MTRIEEDWLNDPKTQRVLRLYNGAGHRAFVVGGAVRNSLMGRAVTDIDIATSATPEEGMALAEAAGLRVVPSGIDHGTVTILVDHVPYEVTTFRRDVETDGRRAVVAFTDDLIEDAHRRDFTINALYADAEGHVHDPVGGLSDLVRHRIVFVGDARARVEEDHLRSLRFFRFYAEYGDPEAGPDAEALAAIAARLDGLDRLARERVGAEMKKLLGAKDPAPALAGMETAGVLSRLLPGADGRNVAPLVHLEEVAQCSRDWMRRLAALGGQDAAEHLRLSRQEAKTLGSLRHHLDQGTSLREIAWRDGKDMAWHVELIRRASLGMGISDETDGLIARAVAAEFPLRADDLMPKYQGPALGRAIKKAEKLWLDSDFTLDRVQLLEELGLGA